MYPLDDKNRIDAETTPRLDLPDEAPTGISMILNSRAGPADDVARCGDFVGDCYHRSQRHGRQHLFDAPDPF